MKRVKIIVTGVVQGVGYRYFCYKKAIELNINGFAKNLYNGNVEIDAEGNDGMIGDFLKEINIGPSYSSVKGLTITELKYEGKYTNFSIYWLNYLLVNIDSKSYNCLIYI